MKHYLLITLCSFTISAMDMDKAMLTCLALNGGALAYNTSQYLHHVFKKNAALCTLLNNVDQVESKVKILVRYAYDRCEDDREFNIVALKSLVRYFDFKDYKKSTITAQIKINKELKKLQRKLNKIEVVADGGEIETIAYVLTMLEMQDQVRSIAEERKVISYYKKRMIYSGISFSCCVGLWITSWLLDYISGEKETL